MIGYFKAVDLDSFVRRTEMFSQFFRALRQVLANAIASDREMDALCRCFGVAPNEFQPTRILFPDYAEFI